MFGKKNKEEKPAKQSQWDIEKRRVAGEHMAGLPLPQAAFCLITFEENCVSFFSGGSTFNLNYEKISAMNLSTSTEIESAYISSVGGAVAGAALFGPLGALVGGRTKEKKVKKVEHYMIFTYLKDGRIDYISVKVQENHVTKAAKLVDQYRSHISQQGSVTEL